jgi:hypothetical protein
LGAVPADEIEQARAHLADCPDAHQLLRELLSVAALLPYAAEPAEPPARLRANILAAARAESGRSATTDRVVSPAPTPLREIASESSRSGAPSAAAPIARSSRWGALSGWMAAAAVLALAIGMGAWALRLNSDLDQARADRLALEQRMVGQRDLLASMASDSMQMSAFVVSKDAPNLATSRGMIVRPKPGQTGKTQAYFEGLQALETGRVYHLWALRAGQPRPLNTFTAGADGSALVEITGDMRDADTVAITIERGPAATPSGAPVFTSQLQPQRLSPLINFRTRDDG